MEFHQPGTRRQRRHKELIMGGPSMESAPELRKIILLGLFSFQNSWIYVTFAFLYKINFNFVGLH